MEWKQFQIKQTLMYLVSNISDYFHKRKLFNLQEFPLMYSSQKRTDTFNYWIYQKFRNWKRQNSTKWEGKEVISTLKQASCHEGTTFSS